MAANVTSAGHVIYEPYEFLEVMPALSVIIVVVLIIAAVLGTFGNVLILVAVGTQRSLQTVDSVFVVHLACCDLYVTTVADALSIVGKILGWRFFDRYPMLCRAVGSLCTVSCVGSLLTLSAMSLSRYVLICHNAYYARIFSTRNSILMCFGFLAVGFALISLNFYGVGDHSFDHKSLECIWDRMANHDYTTFFAVAMVMVPIVLTGLAYLRLYLHVRKSRIQIHSHHHHAGGGDDLRSRGDVSFSVAPSQTAGGDYASGEDISSTSKCNARRQQQNGGSEISEERLRLRSVQSAAAVPEREDYGAATARTTTTTTPVAVTTTSGGAVVVVVPVTTTNGHGHGRGRGDAGGSSRCRFQDPDETKVTPFVSPQPQQPPPPLPPAPSAATEEEVVVVTDLATTGAATAAAAGGAPTTTAAGRQPRGGTTTPDNVTGNGGSGAMIVAAEGRVPDPDGSPVKRVRYSNDLRPTGQRTSYDRAPTSSSSGGEFFRDFQRHGNDGHQQQLQQQQPQQERVFIIPIAKRETEPAPVPAPASGAGAGSGSTKKAKASRRRRTSTRSMVKLARTLFIIYVVFSVCWLPFSLLLALDSDDTGSHKLHVTLVVWAHLHPSLNWLVYFHTNSKFHEAFRKLLRMDKCCT